MNLTEVENSLVNTVPCGILTANNKGTIVFVNEFLCKLLDYSPSALEDESIEKIFTVSAKIFFQTHLFPMLKMHQSADEIFLSLKPKNGNSIPVIATAKKNDDLLYFVFVTVWRRKEYEEEILNAKRTAEAAVEKNEVLIKFRNELELRLAEADRQMTRLNQFNNDYIHLSRIISHDLHEPIRKLLIHIDILRNNVATGDIKINEQLIKMTDFTNRLKMLTYSLQEYVAIDISRESIQPLNFNELIKKAFQQVQNEEAADAIIDIEEMPVIEGLGTQIHRVLVELFRNSFKFRKEDEPLRISIRSTEFNNNLFKEIKSKYRYVPFVRIELEDNGISMSDEYNEYIFELFKKAHPEKPGAGFGLALCRKIIQKHNGSIYARPTSKGLLMTILLPLSQKEFS